LYPYFEDRKAQGAFRVVHADHVTLGDGTGLVHQAPYGEEDFAHMVGMGIEMFDYLDDQGNMKDEITQFKGMFYKKANKYVMEDLENRNLLFAHEDHEHQMPMCWRTDTPLIYKPIKSWYVKVSSIRDKMVSENNEINWVPEHIKDGRFGNWLADARDWALSRNRYWGTPLPAWVCDKCGNVEVLGSIEEVKEKSGVELKDPHKPFVDEVTYKCPKCGGTMQRVKDVIDVWYDSGSMPFARFHYPFENKEKFQGKYPAEFIAEGVDQTRGCFYTLHVLGVALFNQKAFKNVIVNGLALAPDGTKMSKSKRNYTEINTVLDQFGADSMRLYFLSSPIVHGEEVIFDPKYLKEIITSVMLPYWNSIKYFLSYSGETVFEDKLPQNTENIMDKWILARLTETIKSVNENMDEYLLSPATKSIFDLIDDLSKWYIRRSRDRFVNNDKDALNTLYFVLLETTKLIAPFAPFMAESVYQTLTNGSLKESVHLEDYPIAQEELLDETLISQMKNVRDICSLGLNIRDENRIKVRQPLSKAYIPIEDLLMQGIVKGELNVKEVIFAKDAPSGDNLKTQTSGSIFTTLDTNITEDLRQEGLLNELQRGLQVARKENGCQVGQEIEIKYTSEDSNIEAIISSHLDELKKVVFIRSLEKSESLENPTKVKVGDSEVLIEILK
jgi:isoleucyl-tRNA synthetase